ncbi:ABC transporter ATP-binding protein [Hazenella sp. IB182353]|uniref:ABC transporter ATP-binding protein n=1 Tax=Polycladospora coralii TaxID=2771432 RepID=UPI00174615AF|nr:ABC transporter ATP-binding protein [Polycladospora coralii]MBS7530935.1 ABC transporter ATP-binding protein [Polycladospora coralii]
MNVIELKQLTKRYGRTRGIENLSFHVEEGEIFGFIGPNGAGKSTTIRTLLSLIYPTSGSATIFGKDTVKYAPEIKKEIGYLPSEVFYYDNMKVKDLLKYSARFYKKDCHRRMVALADQLNLDLDRKIDDLSFGNKKKVGIIQGLLHEPRLIILDEPTGGLDPLMQQTFFEILRLENQKGTTILFSSHILSEVQKLCDRVAIIKEGQLVKVEKISELKANSHKKVEIETSGEINERFFELSGINHVERGEHLTRFWFSGNMNTLLEQLTQLELMNLWIEEPDLEEIFMHYYEKER